MLRCGLRLLIVDLLLEHSTVRRWRAILQLCRIAADMMPAMILRIRRLQLKRLLTALVLARGHLHRGTGVVCSSAGCSGIVLLKDQLHANPIELIRFVGVLLCLVEPIVSPSNLATTVIFIAL